MCSTPLTKDISAEGDEVDIRSFHFLHMHIFLLLFYFYQLQTYIGFIVEESKQDALLETRLVIIQSQKHISYKSTGLERNSQLIV